MTAVPDDWCRAVTLPGSLVTMLAPGTPLGFAIVTVIARRRDWMCTQDAGHDGGHSACDGHGHILAKWPRRDGDHYWTPEGCARCRHWQPGVSAWQPS